MAFDDRPAARPSAAQDEVDEAGSSVAIHLRVSRDVKGRWVACSRAAGQKLGDWIVEGVEAADDNAISSNSRQTGR